MLALYPHRFSITISLCSKCSIDVTRNKRVKKKQVRMRSQRRFLTRTRLQLFAYHIHGAVTAERNGADRAEQTYE